MQTGSPVVGFFGIGLGAAALMLAIVHFWAGPFSPKPSVESTIAEKAVAIRDATVAALKGEEAPRSQQSAPAPRRDLDALTRIAIGVMAGLGLILGVVSAALREPLRVAAGGVVLGGAALAFQFTIIAIGLIAMAILIGAVLGQLDFG